MALILNSGFRGGSEPSSFAEVPEVILQNFDQAQWVEGRPALLRLYLQRCPLVPRTVFVMRCVSQTLAEEMMNETHDPHFLRKGGCLSLTGRGLTQHPVVYLALLSWVICLICKMMFE